MIAPEKWRSDESLSRAENVARRSLPLALGHDPVLDASTASARIAPARDIAGGKDSRHICLQKFVDHYEAVGSDTRSLSMQHIRTYTDSSHHHIAIQHRSV